MFVTRSALAVQRNGTKCSLPTLARPGLHNTNASCLDSKSKTIHLGLAARHCLHGLASD